MWHGGVLSTLGYHSDDPDPIPSQSWMQGVYTCIYLTACCTNLLYLDDVMHAFYFVKK